MAVFRTQFFDFQSQCLEIHWPLSYARKVAVFIKNYLAAISMQSTENLFVLRLSSLFYFCDVTEQIIEKYGNGVVLFSNSQRAKKHVYQQFVSSTVATKSRKLGQTWILYRAFYGVRKAIHVSTLAEVNETIENAKNVVNIVVLPPEAGDSGSQESNVEDVADSLEEIFDIAGNLKWKKTLRVMKKQKRLYHQLRRKNFQTEKKL